NIASGNVSEAIKNLLSLLPDVTDALSLPTLYTFLLKLIPDSDDRDFAKIVEHLPRLLACSAGLYEEQRQLALVLASKCICQAKTLTLNIRFPMYFQAMDYFAKAIHIAEVLRNEPLIKEMHQYASRLILESYLAVETFQAKLEQARNEGKPEDVKSLLLLL